MSQEENKKAQRSIAEIQSDYQQLCVKAGHTQYQIFVLGKELEMMNSNLRDLNLEAAAVKSEEPSAEVPAPAPAAEVQQ